MANKWFRGRTLVIATMHGKEGVIGPLLEGDLGVNCVLPEQFDTDQFGTFSGETKREASAIASARKKCIAAMRQTKSDLAAASEGSFGPHPNFFFGNANEEFLVLIDQKNNFEIIAQSITAETNLAGELCFTLPSLVHFAERCGFPSHGVILKEKEHNAHYIEKEIVTLDQLVKYGKLFLERNQQCWIETDMRAMRNPTRMKHIEEVTRKLLVLINQACPSCACPGFSIEETIRGLPCEQCGFPTSSTQAVIYRCKKCQFEKKQKYPNNKVTEDPMYCAFCNP